MAKEVGVTRKSPIKKTKRFVFSLTEEELREIKERAFKKNIAVAIWVRRAIVAQILQEKKYE